MTTDESYEILSFELEYKALDVLDKCHKNANK